MVIPLVGVLLKKVTFFHENKVHECEFKRGVGMGVNVYSPKWKHLNKRFSYKYTNLIDIGFS